MPRNSLTSVLSSPLENSFRRGAKNEPRANGKDAGRREDSIFRQLTRRAPPRMVSDVSTQPYDISLSGRISTLLLGTCKKSSEMSPMSSISWCALSGSPRRKRPSILRRVVPTSLLTLTVSGKPRNRTANKLFLIARHA